MKKDHVNRRDFLKTAGMGSLAALGACTLPSAAISAINAVEPMKITKIDTVRIRPGLQVNGFRANWVWVRLYTDNGLVGLGESYPGADGHIGIMKELASRIIGRDPTDIERLWQDIYYYIGYKPVGGADFRMLTAMLLALQDAWEAQKTKDTWNATGLKWVDFLPREERGGAEVPSGLAEVFSS